jgi:hypothetical protein
MTVELFGLARALAGAAFVEVPLREPATREELIAALGTAVPLLVGSVIAPDRISFLAPNYLLLDGARSVDAGVRITAGDRPCVMMLASGG